MEQEHITQSNRPPSSGRPSSSGQNTASAALSDSLALWRNDLTKTALRATLVVGLFAVLMGSYTAYRVGNLIAIPLYVVFYLLALAFTFWRGIPYVLQTWLIIGLFYVIGVFETLNTGRTGDGRILLLAFALIAALFYGRRAGLVAIGLNVLAACLFAGAPGCFH